MSATLDTSGALSARASRVRRRRIDHTMAVLGAVVLIGHGSIHLMGVALFWRLGETADLRFADARPAAGSGWGFVVGAVWLLATVLFLVAAVLLLRRSVTWRPVGALAALISAVVLLPMAAATGVGLGVDVALLGVAFFGFRTAGAEKADPVRVPGEGRRVRAAWSTLVTRPAPTEVFSAELVAALPEPARRWLTHAIPVGTPLWSSAQVAMLGQIKLGSWRRFTAHQVVTPSAGYIWAATAWLTGLPVRGFDRFSSGTGEMRWRLLGLIPVVTAVGADVGHSAAGRLVSEIVLAPTGFRAATWTPGRSADHVVGTWLLDGQEESVELQIGPAGEVRSVLVSRWGNPGGERFGRYPFGCTMHSEAAFNGVIIPAAVSAGWWWGTDRWAEGEFFRATITEVSHT